MNAHAEWFSQTLRQGRLDHFVVFGEKHLRHLLAEFLAHYNSERPNQVIGNELRPGEETPPALKFPVGLVRGKKQLGGMLRHYHRAAV